MTIYSAKSVSWLKKHAMWLNNRIYEFDGKSGKTTAGFIRKLNSVMDELSERNVDWVPPVASLKCRKCNKKHKISSKLGREHMRYMHGP